MRVEGGKKWGDRQKKCKRQLDNKEKIKNHA